MLSDLFNSEGYQPFMKKLLWMAIIVTALGVIFYFTHLNGGVIMLECEIGTLFVCGIMYVIRKIVENK